jgi:sulfate transport system permease protein
VLPLVVVFASAFSKHRRLFSAFAERALSAIKLTLLVAAISVGLNLVFGVVPPGQSRNSNSAARPS